MLLEFSSVVTKRGALGRKEEKERKKGEGFRVGSLLYLRDYTSITI